MAKMTNLEKRSGSLADMLVGADVFIGVSAPGVVTTEMVKTMNQDAILFACANPTPEIFPDDAKAGGARVVATGRSDFPNQINNVLAFPGDKYVGENILIHEFAHLFHTIGIVGVEPDFDDRLEKCRQNALPRDCGRIRMLFQIKKSILQNVCSRSSTVTAIRRLRIKYTMP